MRAFFQKHCLLVSIAMSGFCGILAELSLFNLANALVGGTNIVLTYTMGIMMFSMGVGALLIKIPILQTHLLRTFILIELALSFFVCTSIPCIHFLASYFPSLNLVYILLYSCSIGILIGLEIPLILLVNQKLKQPLSENSAWVLFADYLGSLLAFIAFAHWLLTQFGVAGSAQLGAFINWTIACITFLAFFPDFIQNRSKTLVTYISIAILGTGIFLSLFSVYSPQILENSDKRLFRDSITFREQTPYQKIILTEGTRNQTSAYDRKYQPKVQEKLYAYQDSSLSLTLKSFKSFKSYGDKKDIRLFINGGLQFSTLDEHMYHEMLVHPAAYLVDTLKHVFIGGGGDGMALREVLKYSSVTKVWVVDLDPKITELFSHDTLLTQLNDSSYHDPRVQVVHQDAFVFLKESSQFFDLIILDFPDPHREDVAKLYSTQMYQLSKNRLTPNGILVTQSTSPLYHRMAFLIIHKTLQNLFPEAVLPLHVTMPTFGQWGFQIASPSMSSATLKAKLDDFQLNIPAKYLHTDVVQASHRWSPSLFQGYQELPLHDWLHPTLPAAYRKW